MTDAAPLDVGGLTPHDFEEGSKFADLSLFPEEQRRTAYAISALRSNMAVDLIIMWMKWGLPIMKDLVVMELTRRMETVGMGADQRSVALPQVLHGVDWDQVSRLFDLIKADYVLFCAQTGEANNIQPFMDGMEYALKGKLPGVLVPGDLYAKVVGAAASS